MNTDFFKIYGAKERQDGIVVLSSNKACIYVGFGKDAEDAESGYNWRKDYDHIPTIAEVKADIEALINGEIEKKILSGFEWRGIKVWLSLENQMNFKAAYDLAVQTDGERLPKKMKLGEDEDGRPVYHTFEDLAEFTDFYTKAIAYVSDCLNEGWEEKDSIDYDSLLTDE